MNNAPPNLNPHIAISLKMHFTTAFTREWIDGIARITDLHRK